MGDDCFLVVGVALLFAGRVVVFVGFTTAVDLLIVLCIYF